MHGLLIVADALPTWLLGCYGHDWVHTPRLDQLAVRGTTFDRHCATFSGPLEYSPRQWLAVSEPKALFDAPVSPLWSELEAAIGPVRYVRRTPDAFDVWSTVAAFVERADAGQRTPVDRSEELSTLFDAGGNQPHGLWIVSLPGVDEITEWMSEQDEALTAEMVEAIDDLAVDGVHRPSDEEILATATLAAAATRLDDWIGRLVDAFEQRHESTRRFVIVTAWQGRGSLMELPRIVADDVPQVSAEMCAAAQQLPLIAVRSDVPPAGAIQRCDALTQWPDVVAAIAQAFGVTADSVEGVASGLWESLEGEEFAGRPAAVTVNAAGELLCQGPHAQVAGTADAARSAFQQRVERPEAAELSSAFAEALRIAPLPDDPWALVDRAVSDEDLAGVVSTLAQHLGVEVPAERL